MRTRIISAFPGTGKSYYHKNHHETTLDSDSSLFSWTTEFGLKVRHPDFPANYIQHIKENIGKYEFIFVSSHKEVRDALLDSCIFFYLVYPDECRKEDFLKRFRDRGSPESFVSLLSDNWEKWIKECDFCKYGCHQARMILPNLEDEIEHIVCSENGDEQFF